MVLCHVPVQIGRWRWLITGQVQGVGFRPFVYRLASDLHLSGFVRNEPAGVTIEAQGDPAALLRFESALRDKHPPLASIRSIIRQSLESLSTHEHEFAITGSDSIATDGRSRLADVTIDTAICPACVREILSPDNRRRGYGLTNCTDCGPRFSIVRRVPYDRCNTTMAPFEMCPACASEYTSPSDRRFHAQPIACHDCGPTVSLVDSRGQQIDDTPITAAAKMLADGKILAIKGLGGFHLSVRADDESAVARLRKLKKRDHKPFALMVRSIEAARELAQLSDVAAATMQSPACPIVLAPRRDAGRIATSVAPRQYRLGLMLPYTPIHHLLFQWLDVPALVMTSGNLSDEPLVITNQEALDRLGPMCDAILWHDRPIERGVDDSVVLDLGASDPIFLRRARGYVPGAITLPSSGTAASSAGLCLGAELKNTVAVVREGSAILSHHLGDLTHPLALENFRKAVDDLRALFDVQPSWIAHDLHPMYVSTTYAKKLSAELRVPLVPVQHHHAHAASLMAEHGVTERILAIVCDGTGFGPDGSIWGGELLACDLRGFDRVAHLRPLRLPGGDAAARDVSRSGMALLYQAWGDEFIAHPAARRLISDDARRQVLCRMIRDDIACARSTGAGRYFDGVAALLGLSQHNHFEAQAAMAVEAAAHLARGRRMAGNLFKIRGDDIREIDFSPLVRELVCEWDRGVSPEVLALLFHEQFAQAWAHVVAEASVRIGLRTVGLSGGVFCNAWLTRRLTQLLEAQGLRVLRHRTVPPNDGGIALGQSAVAATRMGA